MAELFSDSDSEVELTINKDYAERYNNWRQKEELQKLKDRHGEVALKKLENDDDDDDQSSTSEEEDENAKELTQEVEKEFFRTLSCLKKRDPRIYDENVKFFDAKPSEIEQIEKKKHKEDKPLLLRDYERKLILEREGKFSDDDDYDEEEEDRKAIKRPHSPTHVEEQKAIKESFKNILEHSEGEDEEADWGGLFKQRKKTKEELDREEEDYREWLRGQKDQLPDKNMESDLKYLHDYWNDPNLDSSEAFLKDYILNKRFLDLDNEDYIPSYNEIVHDSSEDLSEDERTMEKQEEFEHKYNFRFEEPDQEFIKRYPRTMENSLRKKDDRRKRKRQEIRERKEHEKEIKREEIKQLKALKRKELMEKIEKIKLITGNNDLGFKDEDLEEDFNPEEYDKRMNELFNSDYYGMEEEEGKKPEFPELDNELELENWDNWKGENYYENGEAENYNNYEPHCEDPGFIMDCDYDPKAELQRELIRATKKKKKHRKQSKFAEVLSKVKPVFDPNDQTFDEYVEEYYKLDFEDIIGDLPCRFKYRKVVPNSFGLSVDEILKADDKELNRWCSLKKTIQYRPEHVEKYDVKAYKRKATDENLKRKTLTSLYSQNVDVNEDVPETPRKKMKIVKEDQSEKNIILGSDENKKKKKKKKSVEKSVDMLTESNINGENSEDYNGNIEDNDVTASRVSTSENVNNSVISTAPTTDRKKKRRKKKNKEFTSRENGPDSSLGGTSSVLLSDIPQTTTKNVKPHHEAFRKKKMKNKNIHESCVPEISDSRLKAYGLNPKKFKNKLLYNKKKS
ncbi:protein KRI1 homolog [Anabrus simplex]|uniref:protein KRI1 homolog n=1 Tax=Anabrus simplex TaxID=316456 RepID=UPI0035A35FFE